jgi:hypothetical protein
MEFLNLPLIKTALLFHVDSPTQCPFNNLIPQEQILLEEQERENILQPSCPYMK